MMPVRHLFIFLRKNLFSHFDYLVSTKDQNPIFRDLLLAFFTANILRKSTGVINTINGGSVPPLSQLSHQYVMPLSQHAK